MKRFFLNIIVIFAITCFSGSLAAQTEKKQQNESNGNTQTSGMTNANADDGFVPFQENTGKIVDRADSSKQKAQGKGKRGRQLRRGQNDSFIDRDGDGINDNRCKGMGLGNCRGKCRKGGRK